MFINLTAEQLAEKFHETYERLAPSYGYKTREESAKPWADVPEKNKQLMIAVCQELITHYSNIDEIDRNARAYGFEIGRGQEIGPQVNASEDNPFLSRDWRDLNRKDPNRSDDDGFPPQDPNAEENGLEEKGL